MGRAKVLTHLGGGLYSLEVDTGDELRDKRVAAIDKRLVELNAAIAELQAKFDAAQAKVDAARAEADAHIDELAGIPEQIESINDALVEAYEDLADAQAATGDPETVAEGIAAAQAVVTQLEKDLADAQKRRDELLTLVQEDIAKGIELAGERDKIGIDLRLKEAEKAQLNKEKSTLQGLPLKRTVSAWCADLTTDATGDVGTIEIPGEPQAMLMMPGGQAGLGKLLAREMMTPEQVFWNAAVLPGWQRFKPTYRKGTITSVNKPANKANVLLDDAVSTAQSLSVMRKDAPLTLTDVPVQYMSCNARVFEPGDRCVVEFTGMNWDNPKVIGFVDNPKRCRIPQYLYAGVSIGFDGVVNAISGSGTIHTIVSGCGESGMKTLGTGELRSQSRRSVGRWFKPEIFWGTVSGVPDTVDVREGVVGVSYKTGSNGDIFEAAPGIETLISESGPAYGYPANGGSVKLIRQQGMKSADGVTFVPMEYRPDVTLPPVCPGEPNPGFPDVTAGLIDIGTAGLLGIEGYTTTRNFQPVSGVDTATGATMEDLDAYLRTLFTGIPEGFTVTDVLTGDVIEYEFDGYGDRGQEVMDDPADEEPYLRFVPVARYRPVE
jgi:hypothetical protein